MLWYCPVAVQATRLRVPYRCRCRSGCRCGVGAIAGGGKGAAWGAGIGAILSGTAGAIIGKKMDKQAAELARIEGAQVEKISEGEAIKVTFESGIFSPTNSSTLNSVSRASLDKFATSLLNNPDTDVKIYGHTDSTGSDAINNPLSERRAESVYNYLLSKGIDGSRMIARVQVQPSQLPITTLLQSRAQNRRVEIFILPNAKMVKEAQEQAN